MEKVCCVFGHRKVEEREKLKKRVYFLAEKLVTEEGVTHFLFGSKSDFDKLCLEAITELKQSYPQIQRIYVRAEFPYIDQSYENYLLKSYDHSYYPESLLGAGRASYVKRNREMIDKSDVCLVYYKEDYQPPMRKNSKRDLLFHQPKSGTALAFSYAVTEGKKILNLAEERALCLRA